MARRIIVEFTDDYDSSSVAEETVNFALDGVSYEIDLSEFNAQQLRNSLEQWVASARKVGRTPGVKRPPRPVAADQADVHKIRDWARKEGLEVSTRGRVSAQIVAAYQKAH
ncbi:histone-like nucleoid-structuring protein Lsr2 [Nocardia takedensis]|uniref:histone-like nucleoid-structuring protein Lsr2 n=1 Tax=Nocardia takedensis TaxID=259390 RepID=UPI000594FE39|nr:Lsr2 family protein [Nocardia takedensis]